MKIVFFTRVRLHEALSWARDAEYGLTVNDCRDIGFYMIDENFAALFVLAFADRIIDYMPEDQDVGVNNILRRYDNVPFDL